MRFGLIRVRTRSDVVAPYPYRSHRTVADSDLLQHVEKFLSRTSMAPTRFGREVMGEASLVARMRAGRSLSLSNANKLVDWIAAYEAAETSEQKAA